MIILGSAGLAIAWGLFNMYKVMKVRLDDERNIRIIVAKRQDGDHEALLVRDEPDLDAGECLE